jgi:hypothetical protein
MYQVARKEPAFKEPAFDDAGPVDEPAPAPQVYCWRLCRACLLILIGVAVHAALPAGTGLPIPVITPLKFVLAVERPGDRSLLIEQQVVFARETAELGLRPVPDPFPRASISTVAVDGAIAMGGTERGAEPDPVAAVGTAGDLRAETITGAAAATPPQNDAPPVPRDEPAPRSANAGIRTAEIAERSPAVAALVPVDPLAAAPSDGPTAALPAARTVNVVTDEDLVRRLLDEYTGAFERLDVGATKAVWPSVDGKALQRAYAQLSAQRLTLQSCGITISGSTANARCRGSATYQPRIGNRPVEIASREWTFDLSKADTDWRIVNTFVR